MQAVVLLAAILVLAYGVISCSWGDDQGWKMSSSSVEDWSGGTAAWLYDGTQVQYELPTDIRTVELSANGPVEIFMVKMNSGDEVIRKEATRYVVSASRAAAGGRSGGFGSDWLASLSDGAGAFAAPKEAFSRRDYAPARDFVPPLPEAMVGGSSRSAFGGLASVVPVPLGAVPPITPTVGQTKKELWVDLSRAGVGTASFPYKLVGGVPYTKRPALLRAAGQHCYVWVVDGYFSETSTSDNTVTSTQVKDLADKFDRMYPLVREVFGSESELMMDKSGLVSITSASDTRDKVNIVVYDIEGDYTAGQTGGTMGYFWAKDYYTAAYSSGSDATSLTNCGKYFYVDSYFLSKYPGMSYSTLAHEFQHMINFGEKTVSSMATARDSSQVQASQTWSNEMMSMVCEDMMQSYLGLADKDSPIARLPWFCQYYYLSGLTDWLGGTNVQVSYGGAYAFGAYLARNYGGRALIKEIATNNYVDQEAITQALATTVGKHETFESVFRKYAQALVLDKAPASANVPSFNTSVDGIGGGSMKAIDIFRVKNGSGYGTIQPKLLGRGAGEREDLRPYGFTLHSIGYTESAGKTRLTFSSPVHERERVYVLVQPR